VKTQEELRAIAQASRNKYPSCPVTSEELEALYKVASEARHNYNKRAAKFAAMRGRSFTPQEPNGLPPYVLLQQFAKRKMPESHGNHHIVHTNKGNAQ
jgi:hypothetical protein